MSYTQADYDILLERLRRESDERYRVFNESLIPGTERTYGVRAPALRKIAKELLQGDWLKKRFTPGGDFPHEIGLFLDYPPEDVEAFIAGSSECKLCGYWKVYGDVDGARERFACYDACRLCLCRMLAAGNTISQLLQTA